jgi:hypothetical protein
MDNYLPELSYPIVVRQEDNKICIKHSTTEYVNVKLREMVTNELLCKAIFKDDYSILKQFLILWLNDNMELEIDTYFIDVRLNKKGRELFYRDFVNVIYKFIKKDYRSMITRPSFRNHDNARIMKLHQFEDQIDEYETLLRLDQIKNKIEEVGFFNCVPSRNPILFDLTYDEIEKINYMNGYDIRLQSELDEKGDILNFDLCSIYSEQNSEKFLALELDYIEGIPLDVYIEELSNLTQFENIIDCFLEMMSVLCIVHSETGLMHNDLDYSNIIVSSSKSPRNINFSVIDFTATQDELDNELRNSFSRFIIYILKDFYFHPKLKNWFEKCNIVFEDNDFKTFTTEIYNGDLKMKSSELLEQFNLKFRSYLQSKLI